MAIIVDIKGFDGVKKMLNKADEAVTKGLSNEMDASAKSITSSAKRLAPVDLGFLRNSIVNEKLSELTYVIEARAKYAAYIEFGTGGLVTVPAGFEQYALGFKGRGLKKVNMRSQPFLIPSLQMEVPKLLKRLKDLINA